MRPEVNSPHAVPSAPPSILLRPLCLEDVDERLTSWFVNEDGHLDYFTGSGRPYSLDTLRRELSQDDPHHESRFYGVLDADTDQLIGTVRIGAISWQNKTSDLVTLIGDRAYLGRGVAKQAIRLGNQLAFEELGLRKLAGGMVSANLPSIKAYLAADWVIEGILADHYVFDGQVHDRVLVACFNPHHISSERLLGLKKRHLAFLRSLGLSQDDGNQPA